MLGVQVACCFLSVVGIIQSDDQFKLESHSEAAKLHLLQDLNAEATRQIAGVRGERMMALEKAQRKRSSPEHPKRPVVFAESNHKSESPVVEDGVNEGEQEDSEAEGDRLRLVDGPETIKLEEYENRKRGGESIADMAKRSRSLLGASFLWRQWDRVANFLALRRADETDPTVVTTDEGSTQADIGDDLGSLSTWQWVYLLVGLPLGIITIMMSLALFS